MDGNDESGATLTVGPTSDGMVRILVEEAGREIPMDFAPEEAVEIADELRSAAERVRGTSRRSSGRCGR
jgi:hypothetical protein